MLLGREAERRRIDRVLDAAKAGQSGSLLVLGDPGSGKSALLACARERAGGMRVLTAHGLESEAELPFAGLSALLPAVLGFLDGLPVSQRSALEGALALGPASPGDRFGAYVATLSLLVAAAEEQPLLVVVDDAHWLDASSVEALRFATRRLGEDSIAVLFAAREGELGGFDLDGLEELPIAGLEPGAAAELLSRSASGTIAPAVAKSLIEGCAGNPLALIELPRLLSPAQLAGTEPLDQPLPLGPGLERSYRRRIEALPTASVRALLVAATSDGAMDEVALALAALDLTPEDLQPAETEGLVAIAAGRIEFRHPLLRSAAYHGACAQERREAHGALAKALGADHLAARRAWHLAAAALAPDEGVAGELERAATEARSRGAPGAAGSALAVAARLTPDAERRARRLLLAGQSLHLAGRLSQAGRMLEQAADETQDPLLRAEIQHARGQVEMFSGSAPAAREMLLNGAAAIEACDPAKAVLMLADGAGTLMMEARIYDAREVAEHAHRLAEPLGGVPARVSELVMGQALCSSGETARAREFLARGEPLLQSGALAENAFLRATCAYLMCWLEEEARARALIRNVVAGARSASALGVLPYALAVLCQVEFRLGDWTAAYAAGAESLELARETGQRNELTATLVYFGRLEAAQARAECRAHLEAALDSTKLTGATSIEHLANAALGLLELGLGRNDEAIRRLEVPQRLEREGGLRQPVVGQSAPDLIEAYARAGRLSEAEATLCDLERQAEATQSRWAAAAAARCCGLLAEDDQFERHFEHALSLHEHVPQPFERARTQLCFGERLRRVRRRADAREQLRPALEVFDRLGAAPWAERARRELAATGERPARPSSPDRDELTPAELQVALAVAGGLSNQEVATALFVSRRTVEAHLNRIYRKLAIRSRSQLTRLVLERRLPGQAEADADGHSACR